MHNTLLQLIRNLRQDGAGLSKAERGKAQFAVQDNWPCTLYCCAHNGTSMNPTLCASDLLEIEAYGDRPIRLGDVILFLSPLVDQPLVHRVVRVTAEGVRTKGDNNNRIDPSFIRPEDVIGQVVWATRGKKRRFIYGGAVGLMLSIGMRGLKRVKKPLSFYYHLLARSGLLRRLVPLHKQMRIVSLRRKGRRTFKLLVGNLTIGNYQRGMAYWQIRRPFRLFVDVKSLPK